MGIFSIASEWFRRGRIIDEVPGGGYGSPGGPIPTTGITPDEDTYSVDRALSLSASIGGVRLITNGLSGSELFIDKYDTVDEVWQPIPMRDYPEWAHIDSQPNDYQTLEEFLQHMGTTKLVGGNSYIYLKQSDRTYRKGSNEIGYPHTILSVPAMDMVLTTKMVNSQKYKGEGWQMRTEDDSEVAMGMYGPVGKREKGPVWVGGLDINAGLDVYLAGHKVDIYNSRNKRGSLLHSKLFMWNSLIMGYSPFFIGAPSLQAGLAAEAHALSGFSNGWSPLMFAIAKAAGQDTNLSDVLLDMRDHAANTATRNLPMPLKGEWDFWNSMVTPQQVELVDSRRFTVTDISRLLNIPLPLLASDEITTWGTGVKELMKFYLYITQTPFNNGIAKTLSQLLPRGYRVRIDPSHLKIEDMKDEADYLSKALGSGMGGVPWMTKNEARSVARAVGLLPPISDEEGRRLNEESNVNNPSVEKEPKENNSNSERDSTLSDANINGNSASYGLSSVGAGMANYRMADPEHSIKVLENIFNDL